VCGQAAIVIGFSKAPTTRLGSKNAYTAFSAGSDSFSLSPERCARFGPTSAGSVESRSPLSDINKVIAGMDERDGGFTNFIVDPTRAN
jgi:hypothetical protein